MERTTKELDLLISRVLIGKPEATPEEVRRLLPELQRMDDNALSQKLRYLRSRARSKAPARS